MADVKSALEKALEKAAALEELSPEEKARLRIQEQVKVLLADFYKGDLDRDSLWQKARKFPGPVLGEAQRTLAGSLRLGSLPEDLKRRSEGILALESIKERPNAAALEEVLRALDSLQRDYDERREAAIEELRRAIEQNPQLRMRPVRTADGRTVMQPALSVDEAMQERLAEFLEQHEQQYQDAFGRGIAQLVALLR